MELLKDLELIEVEYKDKSAELIFFDEDKGEIRTVKINKQAFDNAINKYVDDEEKEKKAEADALEWFGVSFDNLAEAIGVRKDVYCYETYNSLRESTTNKLPTFEKDYVGTITEVVVTEVVDNGERIIIKFDYEGTTYGSNMNYSKWINSLQKYFVDSVLKTKQYARFEEKFHIPVSEKEKLVGQKVMIEVKESFGKVFTEIKPFPKAKKK